MNKKEFIKTVSKIKETFEDEFKSEFNSPELIWKLIKNHIIKDKPKEEKSNEAFTCYEIWRPNIPANGCKTQCKECKKHGENQ